MTHDRGHIMLVDADAPRRARIEASIRLLRVAATSLAAIPSHPLSGHAVVLLVDGGSGHAVAAARAAFSGACIIVGGLTSEQAEAVRALRAGADDFVWLGAGDAELARVLTGHLPPFERPHEAAPTDPDGLVGDSVATSSLRAFVRKIAPTDSTVLVTGESGTGKDVVAMLLHRQSRRAGHALVALNCAAIPEALIEGELFGYERGAFSGASVAYPGKLKLADQGTLMLDEIGELSAAGQAKLLRAIESGEAWRLGARAPTRFNVRIIAVTNRDLRAEVRAGRFREDLYYRIAVSQLRLSPLRERTDDILPIARHLLERLCADSGRRPPRIDGAAARELTRQSWPGNVRELRNVLEVALINAEGDCIGVADLPPTLDTPAEPLGVAPGAADPRSLLMAALDSADGNKSLAAQRLNCSRMTLYRRMRRLGVSDDDTVTL